MGKRLWDLAKSRFEIGTFLLAHRHKVADGTMKLASDRVNQLIDRDQLNKARAIIRETPCLDARYG